MAYDSMNNQQLAADILAKANLLENQSQGVMRRAKELAARLGAVIEPTPTPSPTPEPTPAPDPTPAPSPAPSEGFTDFAFDDWITSAFAHADNESFPEGAFRLTANVAKFERIDPIVFPGEDEAGHLHMIWGNTELTGHSTHESLIASGHSTGQGDMINRSAYWTPALLFGDTVWVPDHISNYYKMISANHKNHPRGITEQVQMPEGLKMVFGSTMTASGPNPHVEFRIFSPDLPGGAIKSHVFTDLIPECIPGRKFAISIDAPFCWNGELDSADHRSHLVYPEWNGAGYFEVPSTHPIMIPHISYIPMWTIPDVDMTTLRSSSDMPGMPPLSNMHGDFMDGWHPEAAQAWFENALMRQLNCSSCDFGDGRMGKRPAGFTFEQRPNLIPFAHADTGHTH